MNLRKSGSTTDLAGFDCEHNVSNSIPQINQILSEVFGPLGGWLASIKKALGLQPNGRVEYTDVLRAEGHVEEAEKAGREEAGRSGGHSK